MNDTKDILNIKIENLTTKQAEEQLAYLHKELSRANILYYQQDAPEIDDARYDQLKQRNRLIEERFPDLKLSTSVSDKVGAQIVAYFAKIIHSKAMLSLKNVFSTEELHEFDQRLRRFLKITPSQSLAYIAEPKIDGVSLSLRYVQGKLTQAATRGNGTVGENVTNNAKVISDIPQKIKNAPEVVEIRGEVYMRHDDFITMNQAQHKIGQKLFANPRNAAAGSLRQLNAHITQRRPLKFLAYAWGEISDSIGQTQKQAVKQIAQWGFAIPSTTLCKNVKEMKAEYQRLKYLRADIGYDIDGVVYKVNNLQLQARLGMHSTAPRWAVAYKFPAEVGYTYLQAIEIQVGRTGALSPVARLKPITLGGVVISNATLHNADYIAGRNSKGKPIRDYRDIRVGDWVEVYRAGDVIPKIRDVDISRRTKQIRAFQFPTQCPICHSLAHRDQQDSVTYCSGGLNCPAQAVERLKYFVSRNGFDITGLGDKKIKKFYHDLLLPIKHPADIFTLQQRDRQNTEKLHDRAGWGKKSVQNLFEVIEKKRNISLARLIYALGIRHIGEKTATLLAKNYSNWNNFIQILDNARNKENEAWKSLISIDGIGEIASETLVRNFQDPNQRSIIDALLTHLKVYHAPTDTINNAQLNNKIVVFTGRLQHISRAEAKARAEALGAKISSSISKKTDFVIAGDKAGKKLKKARKIGVKILDEKQWITFITHEL